MEIPIDNSGELQRLQAIVSNLIDRPCWKATWSYGGELHLDIGYKILVLGKHEMGSWFLSTYGSNFTISDSERILIDTQTIDLGDVVDRDKVNEHLPLIIDHKITQADINIETLGIKLTMDNGVVFAITPTDEDLSYRDFPLWTLSTSLAVEVYSTRHYKLK